MYYIINQNNQIVAIDPQLLTQFNIANADEFYKKVALQEVTFELENNTVEIIVDGQKNRYNVRVSPLSGMLGDIRLVDIKIDSQKEENTDIAINNEEAPLSLDDTDLFGIKDESDELKIETPSPTINEPSSQAAETLSIDENEDDLFELILPSDAENAISNIETHTTDKEESLQIKEDEISIPDIENNVLIEEVVEEPAIDFIKDDASQETPQEATPSLPKNDDTPIYIDIAHISEKIGITPDDYNLFLNEYIDTALTFEEALQSNDTQKKEEALHTLSHLSNVLHLPFVGDILEQIKNASLSQRDDAIASFFTTLGRLTTSQFEKEKPDTEEETTAETLSDTSSEKLRAPIDLNDIKPIHFDFQLEEAAKDLSLPVELIEEFVNDFIIQAHEETEKMLEAYQKGDLETVQKIGHLLKGTSSNLRINPLSDTLYEIQFNEDIDRVPELVKNYWAHFLSLEKQIELISKK